MFVLGAAERRRRDGAAATIDDQPIESSSDLFPKRSELPRLVPCGPLQIDRDGAHGLTPCLLHRSNILTVAYEFETIGRFLSYTAYSEVNEKLKRPQQENLAVFVLVSCANCGIAALLPVLVWSQHSSSLNVGRLAKIFRRLRPERQGSLG
jgi:hypothetical protein